MDGGYFPRCIFTHSPLGQNMSLQVDCPEWTVLYCTVLYCTVIYCTVQWTMCSVLTMHSCFCYCSLKLLSDFFKIIILKSEYQHFLENWWFTCTILLIFFYILKLCLEFECTHLMDLYFYFYGYYFLYLKDLTAWCPNVSVIYIFYHSN